MKLRFLMRDGQRVLQQQEDGHNFVWSDVPLVDPEALCQLAGSSSLAEQLGAAEKARTIDLEDELHKLKADYKLAISQRDHWRAMVTKIRQITR